MDKRADVLRQEYRVRFEGNEAYRTAVWKVLCSRFFARYIKPEHTVLDLGAGWGEFTINITAAEKYAMDLNLDCGRHVAGSAKFLHQDCSERWPLDDGVLDVVFTSNFLEHLPNKELIDKTLGEAHRCLKQGGLMICVGPNIRYLPGLYWDYWDHHVPITDGSMAEALKLRQFSIETQVDRFLPYTMSGGSKPPLIAVKAYLRLPLVWPLFGKQFLVIGRR
jgi:ubiquinone/menaquinone biosynthesis C-methylase UbiE